MATSSNNYATPASLTITQTSLASSGTRQSAVVDNGTNKYNDALVGGSTQVGTVTSDGSIIIYAYGTYDDSTMTGGVGTTDQAITWGTTGNTTVNGRNNMPVLGVLDVDATDDNKDFKWGPYSVAVAFGGTLPEQWGILIYNGTDGSFNATGTNNEVQFTGVKTDIA